MEGRGPAAGMPRRPQPGRRARAHRFGFVLVLVLGYACFQVAAPDDAWVRFVTILLGAGTLLAAVWADALSAWLPARPRRRPCWWQPWRGCTSPSRARCRSCSGRSPTGCSSPLRRWSSPGPSSGTCVRSRRSRFTRSPASSRSTCWPGCSSRSSTGRSMPSTTATSSPRSATPAAPTSSTSAT